MHAEHRVGARRPHCGEAVEHHGVRVERARCRSSADSRCTRPRRGASTAPHDLVDRRGREVDVAGAVHLDVDEAGSEQRVTEVDRARRGGPRTGRHDAARRRSRATPAPADWPAVAGDDPRRTRARSPLAVPATVRCAASPGRGAYGARASGTTCAPGAARHERPGSPPCARPARSTRRISSVSNRSWPERAGRGERLDRGASHRLDAVRVGDVQAERRRATSC